MVARVSARLGEKVSPRTVTLRAWRVKTNISAGGFGPSTTGLLTTWHPKCLKKKIENTVSQIGPHQNGKKVDFGTNFGTNFVYA